MPELYCKFCGQIIDGTYISNKKGEVCCIECYEKERAGGK